MRQTKLLLIILLLLFANAAAGIAPNPVKIKGIIPEGTIDVRMVWERVVVDLYRDSSVVEATFFMRNEGESQTINIGFPEMNFYQRGRTADDVPASFSVTGNGRRVEEIRLYTPGPLSGDEGSGDFSLSMTSGEIKIPESYQERPWLLWDATFEEGESMQIVVRYTMPYGEIRGRCRYFTYLMSTGAGWKGSVERAEIVVNLKDLPEDHILYTTPANMETGVNRMVWNFTDLNPSTEHDIEIFYDAEKGAYERSLRLNPYIITIVDGEKVETGTTFDRKSNALQIPIGNPYFSIGFLDKSEEKAKYTSGREAVIVIVTSEHVIKEFIATVLSKHQGSRDVRFSPYYDFVAIYDLLSNGKRYEGMEMLRVANNIDPETVQEVRLIKNRAAKTTIEIITK